MSSYLLNKKDQTILLGLFKELIKYSTENFSYYKNLFNGFDISSLKELSDIQKLPVLERQQLFETNFLQETLSHLPPAYFETSGTTGNPFPVIPDLSEEMGKGFAEYLESWMSLKKDSVKKAIISLPFEMNPVGLKYLLGLMQMGITSIPTGVRTHLCMPTKVIQIIERLKPELLIGRPLEILRYAEAMQLEGKQPQNTSIKKIIFTGEIVSENKWKRMSSIYGGAEVSGIFGLTETDSGGLTCCKKYGYKYHLPQKPYLIVEVLDDDFKQSVKPGEIGNILFTNTQKNYLPLIRYNTGDRGRLLSECDCGIGTPAIEILGRKSDCIHTAHGDIYPIQIENILFGHDNIGSEYQILIKNQQVQVRIEVKAKSDKELEHVANTIRNEILQKLKLDMIVDAYYFGSLANKLGIAKEKAGKLYVLDHCSDDQIEQKLKINYC